MRFAFPKKRQKKRNFFPVAVLFAAVMLISALFGEGGLVHALSLRIFKEQALVALEERQAENQQLQYLIQKVQTSPEDTQNFLAAYGQMGSADVTVYNFKSVEVIDSLETLETVEDLDWWQRSKIRMRLLWQHQWEKKLGL